MVGTAKTQNVLVAGGQRGLQETGVIQKEMVKYTDELARINRDV